MTNVDEIRRQMAQIRHDMHYDVSHVVGDVKEAMDWREAIREHPYILIGVGVAAGYFLVPRRRRQSVHWVEPAAMEPHPLAAPPPARPPKSLARRAVGWTVGMLWPLVGQSAQNYAAAWLENQIKQHVNEHPPNDPRRAPPREPAGPDGGDDFVYRMPRRG